MTRLGTLRVTAPPQPCQPRTPSTTPIRQPPLSKNLRWTAIALVSKLSKELERPSSAIADEVAIAASHDMRTRFPGKDVAPVERNTRRRVYDALKVMVAVGCIQRHGKDLRWIGVDHLTYPITANPNIRVSLCESRRRIGRKKAILSELNKTIKAFDVLFSRHRQPHTNPVLSSRVHFPMVLVNAKLPQVAYSADRRRVRVTTNTPFKVYSETDLVSILADRMALKKPKIGKKRRIARGMAQGEHSQIKKRPVHHSAQLPRLLKRPASRGSSRVAAKRVDLIDRPDHVLRETALEKEKTRTKSNETSMVSTASTRSLTRQATRSNRESKELQRVSQVKSEPKETMTDIDETPQTTQQILMYNIRTSTPSSRHAPDSESIPNAVGTQAGDVSAPLICDEELGIPPLDDGDSSPSDDDPMIGWKTGDDDDFEQVFKAPIFQEV